MLPKLLLTTAIAALIPSPTVGIFCKNECKDSGIRCLDSNTYQFCVNMSDYAVGATSPKICPDGTICTDQGNFPCKVGTVPIPTAPPSPTTLPPCSGPSNFSTESCNTYFQCVPTFWWFEPVIKTCPDGQNFSPLESQCVSAELYKCGTAVTTVAPQTQCNGAGLLPGPSPNQYYECQLIWFQWQPQLRTCPDGQNFDVGVAQCVNTVKGLSEVVGPSSPVSSPVPSPISSPVSSSVSSPVLFGIPLNINNVLDGFVSQLEHILPTP